MIFHNRLARLVAMLALVLVPIACGDDDPAGPGDDSEVASIAVGPPQVHLSEVGQTQQLVAEARDEEGQILRNVDFTWHSSARSVASVDQDGLVTAEGVGSAVITVTAGGVTSGEVPVIVGQDGQSCTTVGDFVAGEIGTDETIEESLTTDDCRDQEWYTDFWVLELAQPQTLQLELQSDDFDAFVYVMNTSLQSLASSDDTPEGTDARAHIALEPGTYLVAASSAGEGETGDYSLTVSESDRSCGPMSDYLVGTADPGGTYEGTLNDEDCYFSDGTYTEAWTLTLDSSATVQINMESGDLDAYLVLLDSSGAAVAQNDDASDETTDARITQTLTAGTYYIFPGTYEAGETGDYTLTISD